MAGNWLHMIELDLGNQNKRKKKVQFYADIGK